MWITLPWILTGKIDQKFLLQKLKLRCHKGSSVETLHPADILFTPNVITMNDIIMHFKNFFISVFYYQSRFIKSVYCLREK